MKAQILVTLEDGTVLQGEALLSPTVAKTTSSGRTSSTEVGASRSTINFQLPLRPFMKRYAAEMSGPKKLTLLVAHLTKGRVKVAVPRSEVEKAWDKMKGLLGGPHNSAYETRARDNGWINSPKWGAVELCAGWEQVLA